MKKSNNPDTMQFGDWKISIISDGTFRLDGGAMFGVVPKALWQKLEPPDEINRIHMGLNCLLIEHKDVVALIDTGVGDKFDAKFGRIYGIERECTLLDNLRAQGIQPEQVTHVIMSHMHFDHIGWNTHYAENGELAITFPNATFFAQRGEWEVAQSPDPRSRASYVKENWTPLLQTEQLELVDGNQEVIPGVQYHVTGGHTKHHAILKITTPERILGFMADLVPTPSHLKTPWVMGYDLYPHESMKVKPQVLQQAFEENWLLIFEHSAHARTGTLNIGPKGWELETGDMLK